MAKPTFTRGPPDWTPEDGLSPSPFGHPLCCAKKADGARCRRRTKTLNRGYLRFCGHHRVLESFEAKPRYQPFLADYAAERWGELVESENLLRPNEAIALFDTKIEAMLKRQQQGDTSEFRLRSLALWTKASEARTDPEAFGRLFRELGNLLTLGGDEEESEERILGLLEKRTRLSEIARRTNVREAETLTKARVMVAFIEFIRIVRESTTKDVAKLIVGRVTSEVFEGVPEGLHHHHASPSALPR